MNSGFKSSLMLVMVFALMFVGCASDEADEADEADELPRILNTNPGAGDQNFTYDDTARIFRVSIEEPNTEQELYWRLVETYGGTAGVALVFVHEGASERIVNDLEDPTRRQLTAVFTTCHHWPADDLENRHGTLYIAVSDRPFLHPVEWSYKRNEISAAFLNTEERPVAFVSWPITIEGPNNCFKP